MKDEEFVKLKHWLDAEITLIHIYLAIIFAFIVHNWFVSIAVVIYVVFSALYAAVRLSYVESKHKGYLKIPKT
jgi:energy-coupling factor transporter transmembrane protein EcfT